MTKEDIKNKLKTAWQKSKKFVGDNKEAFKFGAHIIGTAAAGYGIAKAYNNRDKIGNAISKSYNKTFFTDKYRNRKLNEFGNKLQTVETKLKTTIDPAVRANLQKKETTLNKQVDLYTNQLAKDKVQKMINDRKENNK